MGGEEAGYRQGPRLAGEWFGRQVGNGVLVVMIAALRGPQYHSQLVAGAILPR